jgi:transcriptional regulator with XRE-family HTH domain
MIRSKREYRKSLDRLDQDEETMDLQKRKLEDLWLSGEGVLRALGPMLSFHAQLEEEVGWYTRARRRDFASIRNLGAIGQLLIALRVANGLSQKQLAERLGVSEAQVSRDERNGYRGITLERAQRILEALNETFVIDVARKDQSADSENDRTSWEDRRLIEKESKGLLTLRTDFENLLSNIEPSKHRRDAARDIPADVRSFLKGREDFPTEDPHSRLAGSYMRHTAIHGIKDVDFLVFVRCEDARPEPGEVIEDLRRTLNDLPEELGYGGRAQTLRKQRRSVHVDFDNEDFHLDVVPALIPDGTDEPLLVPDREWGKWVVSHPLGYGKALSELNADTGGRAVPLVKLFKHWRTVQMTYRRPKNYWLEALTYRHLRREWITTEGKSYAELFTDLLRSVYDRFEPKLEEDGVPRIPDPMLGNNLAVNWDRSAFESFMRRLDDSIGWAERALEMDQDQIDDAVALWQKIFGEDYFTDSSELRKRQKAAWIAVGGAYVDDKGRVSNRPKPDGKSLKAASHRFYGEER